MKKYDVVIIGAGTAGLSARKEVAKKTENYLVIDDGPLGTTCARVGCMPSKVLIQVANDYDRRKKYQQMGIAGGEGLTLDHVQVMRHVRALRDRFVRAVKTPMSEWEGKLLRGRAQFIDAHTLQVGGESFLADKIIIATGSRPIIPAPWLKFKDHLIDTEAFFELERLPATVAVLGLGVIGVELGQALVRLGVDVVGITTNRAIGGLSDPKIQDYVVSKFIGEMPLHFNGAEFVGVGKNNKLQIKADSKVYEVDRALVTVGRRANIDNIGLEKLNIHLNAQGIPDFDMNTMKLKELPHIFLPGDVNADRPILHEAADEGIIAGHNAVNDEQCFRRKVNLGVTFSEPNIAVVGKRFEQLLASGQEFAIGEVSFEGQGRSIVKLKEQGLLRLYADKKTGNILGAEMQAPDGEHLAHLLAWAISLNLTVREALKLPFYHPVIEEGLRTALRDCGAQVYESKQSELFRCQDAPIR